ncbi:unnamed protein product [Periconia digitata]|uniref:ATPase inhibitor, mitochondrial n=1 Tax=Periconia digitata TaxID=1303443 RepID=A0A9W4XYH5_9PLEO|nr:unnamed protein product [Periconia digitata]
MFRTSLVKAARPSQRLFSTSMRVMAAGDTGAVRPGGVRSGDAFTKREQASEELYIREEEKIKYENPTSHPPYSIQRGGGPKTQPTTRTNS